VFHFSKPNPELKMALLTRKVVCGIILVIISTACSTTNLVYMSVMEPAPVTLPSTIKNVGVINRSLASEETKKVNAIDQILTAEGPELDKAGAEESITGLRDELIKNERFTEVKLLGDLGMRTTGSGVFPATLAWETVNQICNDNKLDALFSLELFDTDSKITYTTVPVTLKTPLGNVPALEHHANMTTLVKTGWRIYDPASKNIVDEYAISKNLTFTGKGINPVVAASALIGRKDAVKQAANTVGHEYAAGILPFWTRVTRDYYVKGNDNFERGKRKAQTGNWDEAAEVWKKETLNPDNELAGRACYNMAIINEINGELDAAIGWAQKAYEDYGDKLALRYVNILRDRKSNNEQLKRQQEQ
jgi:hypothetical protein